MVGIDGKTTAITRDDRITLVKVISVYLASLIDSDVPDLKIDYERAVSLFMALPWGLIKSTGDSCESIFSFSSTSGRPTQIDGEKLQWYKNSFERQLRLAAVYSVSGINLAPPRMPARLEERLTGFPSAAPGVHEIDGLQRDAHRNLVAAAETIRTSGIRRNGITTLTRAEIAAKMAEEFTRTSKEICGLFEQENVRVSHDKAVALVDILFDDNASPSKPHYMRKFGLDPRQAGVFGMKIYSWKKQLKLLQQKGIINFRQEEKTDFLSVLAMIVSQPKTAG